ncbi:hypothetical protein [Achromobacter marplatensis]
MEDQRSTIAWDLLAKGLGERCSTLPVDVWMDLSCAMKVDSLGGVQVKHAQLIASGPTKPAQITFGPIYPQRVRTGPGFDDYKYVPGDQVLFQAVSFCHHNSFGFYSEPQGAGNFAYFNPTRTDNSKKAAQHAGAADAHIAGMKYAMKLAIEAWIKGDPEGRTRMPQCIHELGDAIKVLEQFKQEGPK